MNGPAENYGAQCDYCNMWCKTVRQCRSPGGLKTWACAGCRNDEDKMIAHWIAQNVDSTK